MKLAMDPYVQRLRAAAEPTRLRILAALSGGEMAVSDLAEMLRQSQPRVSRHLRLLCDSGLLLRTRDQHWIYYRVPDGGEAAAFVTTVLAPLDPADPALALDRERAATLRTRRASAEPVPPAAHPSDESAELATVLTAELGPAAIDALLYVGDEPAALLRELEPRAKRTVACSSSGQATAAVRGDLTQRGVGRAELRAGDPRSLPFSDDDFDTVILDRVDVSDVAVMREAARVLRGGGRLVVVEDYDELERRAGDQNPLLVSRERLARAGLTCTRLRPLDLDSARLLLAIADTSVRRDAAA